MSDTKDQGPKQDKARDAFREEFSALPLEKKISYLMRMEVETLSETFEYVANSSMKVVEKVGDALSEFGTKLEKEAKKAAESVKDRPAPGPSSETGAKPKNGGRRKPPVGKATP